MNYKEKLKDLLKNTAKGFGIGAILSIILLLVLGDDGPSVFEFIEGVIVWTAFFGPIASIIVCARNGEQEYLSKGFSHLWRGVVGFAAGVISCMTEGSIALFVFGIVRLFIGLIIVVPVAIFMAVSYVFNLIYLVIMVVLESGNKLDDKRQLCEMLDKLIPVLSGIVTVVYCIVIIKGL